VALVRSSCDDHFVARRFDEVTAVITWFNDHQRALPWRDPDVSPWGIVVSEFMLQQTQVDRVISKWLDWMQRWPTPDDLATAPTADVLRSWQGLGYPRRAMRLQACAQVIVNDFQGEVPSDEAELLAMPGIGHYTAAAICAFAFHQPTVVLDTNIRRVIQRAWSAQAMPTSHLTKPEVERASALVREHDGARWSAAVMELGAIVCTARNPKCDQCPLQRTCTWHAAGKPENAPTRRKQPSFAGSDRQARGAILRAVSAGSIATPSAIEAAWADVLQREKAMTSLINDGLVIRVARGYSLPK
jgi:A/G-specific adenine glycosylase